MEIDERKAMSGIVATLSAIVMLVGLIGMGICFLFIWSSSQIEVMGAGMGFITGGHHDRLRSDRTVECGPWSAEG